MGMRFGPTRIASYQSSFARKASPLSDIPGLAAPQMKPSPTAGGGMSDIAQMIGPPQMPGETKFQQSVNTERANTANKAATFAAAAPLPTNSAGVYNGAYGSGPEAQKQAEAAKAAFVGNQQTVANQNSGNYFANKGYADDANSRQNATNDANVARTGAETDAISTDTRLMAPARAGVLTAQGAAITGETNRANAAQPHELNRMDSETDQNDMKTAEMKEALRQAGIYGPQMSMAKLAQQVAETDRYKQETPAVIAGAGEAAANTAHLNKLNQQTLENERRLATQKIQALEAPQPQVDPEAAKVDTMKKKIDLYKSAGREDLIEGLLGPKPASSFNSMGQFAYELKKQAFDAKAKAEQGQAAGGGDPHPEGSSYTMPDGRQWRKQGGKWMQIK